MASLGIVLIMAVVVASMGIAIYSYSQNQPNHMIGTAGEPIVVGPVEYVITFEGTFEGSKDVVPEYTFVRIGIVAENISDETTNLSGGQFLFDDSVRHHEAVYGEFSQNDLLFESIEPDKAVQRTTQFDIEFDENKQYSITIRPQKDQSSPDTASVCILNC